MLTNPSILIKRLTKSITTIGPSSEHYDMLRKLFQNGSTCARLNFSHGDYQEHKARVVSVRKLIKELNMPISLMLDTKGPEIRTHKFEGGSAQINKGNKVYIECGKEILGTNKEFSVTYENLPNDVKEGSIILLDDGKLNLQVDDIKGSRITVIALNSHVVKDRRGVNLPGAKLSLAFLSEKDKNDLKFACEQNFDFVAASFVRHKKDVADIRHHLKQFPNGANIKIISKIECCEAVDNFDEILEASDMIMVARGDLGIEVPFHLVPNLQKTYINGCLKSKKPSIVATQMLDSMVKNPHPTRAEVSDVYWAVDLGASATMLSGESANGDYPLESINAMATINLEAEKHMNETHYSSFSTHGIKNPNLKELVQEINNGTINTLIAVNPSYEDITEISSMHLKAQIVVLTNDPVLYTKFGIHFGVKAIWIDDIKSVTNDSASQIISSIPYVKQEDLKLGFLGREFKVTKHI